MKTALRLAAIGALVVSVIAAPQQGISQGRPYASTAPIPDTTTNDPLLQMEIASVRAAEVPPRSAVDIPPYRNAMIIRTAPLETRNDSGPLRLVRLPLLVLVTPDSVEAVLAFYERRLADWQHQRALGGHFFWRGDEEFDPVGGTALTTESVQVREARTVRIVPDARTEIHVRYRPRNLYIEYKPGGSTGRRAGPGG